MEPSIRELVRDWRLNIISEGMYMNTSIITRALTTGNTDDAVQAIALETKKEIDDYSNYHTTGSLPVAEYLQTIMNYEQNPTMEGKSDFAKQVNRTKALPLDRCGEPVEEFFGIIKNKNIRPATDKELDAAKKVIDYVLDCYPVTQRQIRLKPRPTPTASGQYVFATYTQYINQTDYEAMYAFLRSLDSELARNNIQMHGVADNGMMKLVSKYEKGSPENTFNQKAGQGMLSDSDIKQIMAIVRKNINAHPGVKNAITVLDVNTIKINQMTSMDDGYFIASINSLELSWDEDNECYLNGYEDFVNDVEKSISSKFPVSVRVDEGIFVYANGVAESVLHESDVNFDETFDALVESMFDVIRECGFSPNQRNLNEITPIDGGARFSVTPWSNAEKTVGLALCDICEAETDEEITEAMMHFGRVAEAINREYTGIALEADDFDEVEESVGSVARSAALKARNVARKVSRKVDHTVKSANVVAKKTIDPVLALIEKNMEKFKKADAEERREIVIKGGLLPKVMRWLKRGIGLAAGVAVGSVIPVAALITAITFIGMICSDKALDRKERQQILRQLEDEIEIVNEKIDDARGDSSKKKKYELMRIRNKLKRTSDKIRYNLKTSADEDIVQNMKQGKKNVK